MGQNSADLTTTVQSVRVRQEQVIQVHDSGLLTYTVSFVTMLCFFPCVVIPRNEDGKNSAPILKHVSPKESVLILYDPIFFFYFYNVMISKG